METKVPSKWGETALPGSGYLWPLAHAAILPSKSLAVSACKKLTVSSSPIRNSHVKPNIDFFTLTVSSIPVSLPRPGPAICGQFPLDDADAAGQEPSTELPNCLNARRRLVAAGAAAAPRSDSRPPPSPGCAGTGERRAAWPGPSCRRARRCQSRVRSAPFAASSSLRVSGGKSRGHGVCTAGPPTYCCASRPTASA